MDIQTILQHIFGFIGILVVVNRVYNLIFAYFNKPKLPTITAEDLQHLRTKNECPICNSPLSQMRSTSLKECTGCDYKESWDLDPGQLPLVRSNRMVKKK